jgi:hypothetical protein
LNGVTSFRLKLHGFLLENEELVLTYSKEKENEGTGS